MAVKAQLTIKLLADTVLVAESDDQELWRSVFAAIQAGKTNIGSVPEVGDTTFPKGNTGSASAKPVANLSAELGVSEEELVGACGPSTHAPFISLDQRYWEALRRKTGSRGIDAIAPIALAATLLPLWFKHAAIEGSPTVQQCQAVLATIGLRDLNAVRSLRNAEWLQSRNGTVQINPAEWSRAVRIAKAYCLKKSPKEIQDGQANK